MTAIIGTNPTRAFPHGLANQATGEPYVTWSIVTGIPQNTLDEVPRVDRNEIQVDCWGAKGAKSVEALAEAVRDALEPHAHMTAIVADLIDDATQRPRIGMQFTFWQDR